MSSLWSLFLLFSVNFTASTQNMFGVWPPLCPWTLSSIPSLSYYTLHTSLILHITYIADTTHYIHIHHLYFTLNTSFISHITYMTTNRQHISCITYDTHTSIIWHIQYFPNITRNRGSLTKYKLLGQPPLSSPFLQNLGPSEQGFLLCHVIFYSI